MINNIAVEYHALYGLYVATAHIVTMQKQFHIIKLKSLQIIRQDDRQKDQQ